MGVRIQQLPPAIANQIAAGEVIERPASVVKELLENSLDAGADTIHIEVGFGGLNQIKISDNGMGILAEDLPLAVAAHATSKISSLDDLYAIESMGFRGEALASIASIAKVTISSRPKTQEHAMVLRVQGSESSIAPCARAVGTSIDVSDLFFNAPVRKRFLKNERLEFQAIEQVVKRFALSAPHIALSLHHNNKAIFSLPAAACEQTKQLRMIKILGNSFVKNAVFLDVEHGTMRLYGWISGPAFQRSQNDRQWVYINQRMVKDKLINHALKQVYDGLLHPGRFPGCLLYFTINTAEVDVNVHPTKHEVRFQQPRLVHDFFVAQLTKALNSVWTADPSPSTNSVASTLLCEPYPPFAAFEREERTAKSPKIEVESVPLQRLEERAWAVLNKRYSIVRIGNLSYLVDVPAVYQQWLYELLSASELPLAARPLLVPVSYPLPAPIKQRCAEFVEALHSFGVELGATHDDNIAIRRVPLNIPYLDLRLFLEHSAALDSFSPPQLLRALCQAQRVELAYLSSEERHALSLYVEHNEQRHPGLFKALTEDNCRMLLHV